jgi:hypothetical protein
MSKELYLIGLLLAITLIFFSLFVAQESNLLLIFGCVAAAFFCGFKLMALGRK